MAQDYKHTVWKGNTTLTAANEVCGTTKAKETIHRGGTRKLRILIKIKKQKWSFYLSNRSPVDEICQTIGITRKENTMGRIRRKMVKLIKIFYKLLNHLRIRRCHIFKTNKKWIFQGNE